MAKPVQVDDVSFDEKVLKSSQPVLVDFWAPWCGPCHMVAPLVEELASDYQGRVAFFKLNTDENQATAARYGITSIPTLIVFKGGKEASRIIGYRPKRDFQKALDAALAG